MITRNPPIDRLRFIAKTYAKQPWVILDMVSVIANTVGDDHWAQRVREAAVQADPQLAADLENTYAIVGAGQLNYHRYSLLGQSPLPDRYDDVAQAVVAMVAERAPFREPHAADGAFPWMATQLSKLVKAFSRHRSYDTAARAAQQEYAEAFAFFKRSGTAIGIWMRETRPDITKMSWRDVQREIDSYDFGDALGSKGEIVYEWDDGWTIQKLTTDDQLEHEGEAMQHCVGTYCEDVRDGLSEIYSLRSPKGTSHVTVEYDPKRKKFAQVKGKQNDAPRPEYQERIDEWAKEGGLDLSGRMPPHIRDLVDFMDNQQHADFENEDQAESEAQHWIDEVGSAEDAKAWMNAGIDYYNARLAARLENEDVTPEIYAKFPYGLLRHISENDPYGNELERIANIGKVAVALVELEAEHPKVAAQRSHQMSMDFDGPPGVVSKTAERDFVKESEAAYDALDVNEYTVREAFLNAEPADYKVGEAVKWVDAEFYTKDDVEPWWVLGFTPQEAEQWRGEAGPEYADRLRRADLTAEEVSAALRRHPQLNWRLREGGRPYSDPNMRDLDRLIEQIERDRREEEQLRRLNNNRSRRW